MLETKLLEIRDKGTMFSALCVNMNPPTDIEVPNEEYLAAQKHLRHCGYPCDGRPNIVLTHAGAHGSSATNDPYFWGDRTYQRAHH